MAYAIVHFFPEPWRQRGRQRGFREPPQEIVFEVYDTAP
jgi:hypothetical protein